MLTVRRAYGRRMSAYVGSDHVNPMAAIKKDREQSNTAGKR
jgi:hypothetical protein